MVLDREGEKSKEASPMEEVVEPIFGHLWKGRNGRLAPDHKNAGSGNCLGKKLDD